MKNAKRAAALLLCLCMAAALLPAVGTSAEGLNYIAINDNLPYELVNSVYIYGGTYYVPYYAFTGHGLGFGYSYFTSSSTAYLYNADKQIFFNLSTGQTFDSDDYHYSFSAIMRNGVVYLPVSFVCSFFGGLTYSYVSAGEQGSVLRIKNGAQALTDTEFIQAAKNLIRAHYDRYTAGTTSRPVVSPNQGEYTPPTVREGTGISINIIGLPTPALLSVLEKFNAKACFFLTAEDVYENPDMLRRLYGKGHGLGVLCGADAAGDYEETAGLIFEAAFVRTLLVSALGDGAAVCADFAEEAGLVFCPAGISALSDGSGSTGANAHDIHSALEKAESGSALFMDAAGAETLLESVLAYLTENKYTVFQTREIPY